MHFWFIDALLMHFWCIKVHQKCIKSASKVHQKWIKNASKMHQKCYKNFVWKVTIFIIFDQSIRKKSAITKWEHYISLKETIEKMVWTPKHFFSPQVQNFHRATFGKSVCYFAHLIFHEGFVTVFPTFTPTHSFNQRPSWTQSIFSTWPLSSQGWGWGGFHLHNLLFLLARPPIPLGDAFMHLSCFA